MTNQELKKFSRGDLLELLVTRGRENERLQKELEQAGAALEAERKKTRELLENRRIQIDEAGSIAEAALRVNGVFEAAEKAAQQYLENVRQLSGRQEEVCARREAESKARADAMLRQAAEKCRAAEEETRRRCEEMTRQAREESEKYWAEVSRRLESFYREREDLRALLNLDKRV